MRDAQQLHARYAQAFGNLADVAPPQILARPALLDLMQAALDRGTEITEAEVQAIFPTEDFERVLP